MGAAKHFRKGPLALSPTQKERLRKAYADTTISVADIASRFGISDNRIIEVALREGWPLRRPPAQAVARQEQAHG